jgi:uncharacterized protein YukE
VSHFAPPAADPHGLREAARRLASAGRALDARGSALAEAGAQTLTAWQGSASLLMLARVREMRRSGEQASHALTSLSAVTGRYAEAAERARLEVRRLNEMWDEAEQRAARQADGPAQLAQARAELARRHDAVVDDLEEDAYSLQRALQQGDPLAGLPAWLAGAGYTALAAKKLATLTPKGLALGRYAVTITQVARYFDLGRDAVRAAVLGSAEAAALRAALHGRSSSLPVIGRPLTAAGKVFLPLTLVAGVVDVATGGGYEGWRDPATRVAGAAGAAGAGTLLLAGSVLGPVGLGVAGAAVVGYGVWSLGNAIYDHRAEIGAFLGRARDGAARQIDAAAGAVQGTVQRARDTAADATRRVVDVIRAPARLVPRLGGLF